MMRANIALIVAVILMIIIGKRSDSQQIYKGMRPSELLDNHNYGYVLNRGRTVQLTTASAHLVFYYKLPARQFNLSLLEPNCSDRTYYRIVQLHTAMDDYCSRNYSMSKSMHDIRLEALKYLEKQISYVYELVAEVPARNTRKRGI